MKLHHYLWAVAAACTLLPGCSNENLSDYAAAPVFIPGNSEVEIRFAAHFPCINQPHGGIPGNSA